MSIEVMFMLESDYWKNISQVSNKSNFQSILILCLSIETSFIAFLI
jgi:hypothetical protein